MAVPDRLRKLLAVVGGNRVPSGMAVRNPERSTSDNPSYLVVEVLGWVETVKGKEHQED